MKRETLLEIILGTIDGLIFSVGMCMCLIPEWNMFVAGVVTGIIGFVVLLGIIPVYRSTHPKKQHKPIDWEIARAWVIGLVGALIMGFGMSKIMVGTATKFDIILGMIVGVIGLIICVLNYPIQAYLKSNKK